MTSVLCQWRHPHGRQKEGIKMSAEETLITLTADIVVAHVSNNSIGINDLPGLIANVHGALASLSEPAVVEEVRKRLGSPS